MINGLLMEEGRRGQKTRSSPHVSLCAWMYGLWIYFPPLTLRYDMTPLMLAAVTGSISAAQALIEVKADVNAAVPR